MSSSQPAKGRTTASYSALDLLREDIIKGALEPGRWLRIAELRERYDIGASPLREALSKLAAEQFLVQEANRGFRVPPLDPAEFNDVFELRRQLEPSAARRSVEIGDEVWEETLLLAHRRLTRLGAPSAVLAETTRSALGQQWELAHRGFHGALIAACGSPWTQRFCGALNDQFDRYRRFANPTLQVQEQLAAQHDEILDLALRRDAATCEALMNRHVILTAAAGLEALRGAR